MLQINIHPNKNDRTFKYEYYSDNVENAQYVKYIYPKKVKNNLWFEIETKFDIFWTENPFMIGEFEWLGAVQTVHIIGAGSNTLFRDNGVKGVVIKLYQDFCLFYLITIPKT